MGFITLPTGLGLKIEQVTDMRSFLSALLFLGFSLQAQAQNGRFFDQDGHTRLHLLETWSGSYLLTHYNRAMGFVRIDFCGESGSGSNVCRRLHKKTIRYEHLEAYRAAIRSAIVQTIQIWRARIHNNSWEYFKNKYFQYADLTPLENFLEEFDKTPLQQWVLTGPNQPRPYKINSPEIAKTLADAIDGELNAIYTAASP